MNDHVAFVKFGIPPLPDYIAGLSGGSWILMDLVVQNFEVKSLLQEWDLEEDLLDYAAILIKIRR
ncbi:AKR_collapsed_G0047260.mRNA.1.CDS.1 [Saccharomyces cerevisiae]|nr:AKR_collapsed_G0047260.mRNA.1.CDS.1 [Saccharomyces cerevisiae]